jgi:Peptidase family M23
MRRLTAALAAASAALVAAAPAFAGAWVRPVRGPVTRPFSMRGSPYAGGQHRGADLAAPPGMTVRAPCTGRVAVAARIGTSGGVVTVACGEWRASVLPLADVDAHAGARVRAGAPVGTAAPGALHAGLHLGVRRAGRRFGYVDPLRFFSSHGPPPTAPPGPRPRSRARRSAAPVRAAPAPVAPQTGATNRRPGVLPWPAWIGAALLLAGATGEVARRRVRVRPARARTRASPAPGG